MLKAQVECINMEDKRGESTTHYFCLSQTHTHVHTHKYMLQIKIETIFKQAEE